MLPNQLSVLLSQRYCRKRRKLLSETVIFETKAIEWIIMSKTLNSANSSYSHRDTVSDSVETL